MGYAIEFTPTFEKALKKIKKRDKALFARISKKLGEIVENPTHYKPLKKPLAGCRRVHAKSFVVTFEIDGGTVVFLYIKHHDKAYL